MTSFGHVQRITVWTEKGEITFRSKGEYHWYIWTQLRKECGMIQDWWYEDKESWLELTQKYKDNKLVYRPDFTILTNRGEYELEEYKGYFPSKDYTKLMLAAEQYDIPITLIFANLSSHSKNSKIQKQRRRAERLEKHIKRVIYDADKTIFKPIKHLFQA